jgi:hypothetical protein
MSLLCDATSQRETTPKFVTQYSVASPRAAEHAVSEHIKAIDEVIEAVEPLAQSVIDGQGLKPGEVRKRP